ncbi:MAG: zf-HC2 domain-containing protein [Thermoleophilaceae bacterium]|nr:zf-HC2 domain-containing protein [Thermoleophilaceae bacterium]
MLQLLIRHGRSYESLAQTFQTSPARVRERAHEAIDELGARAGDPDVDWRARVSDYALGQLAEAETETVREHLDRSGSTRAWASVVIGALDPLYLPDARPAVPGDAGVDAPEGSPRPHGHESPSWRAAERPLTPLRPVIRPAEEVRGRRGPPWLALLLALLVAAIALAALLIARAGGVPGRMGEDEPLRVERQAVMRPVGDAGPGGGIAVVGRRGSRPQLLLQARLVRPTRGVSHELWLYRTPRDARSLGLVRVDSRGNVRAAAALPADFASYRAIDLSRERDRDPRHSGRSLLRARLLG